MQDGTPLSQLMVKIEQALRAVLRRGFGDVNINVTCSKRDERAVTVITSHSLRFIIREEDLIGQ